MHKDELRAIRLKQVGMVAVFILVTMAIIACIFLLYPHQQGERQPESVVNEIPSLPALPPHSVRSELDPNQYLRIDLPKEYLNRPVSVYFSSKAGKYVNALRKVPKSCC